MGRCERWLEEDNNSTVGQSIQLFRNERACSVITSRDLHKSLLVVGSEELWELFVSSSRHGAERVRADPSG